MKVFLKKNKGISLISLTIAVTVILILTGTIIVSSVSNLKSNKLRNMQADIDNLRNKVSNYYSQYGEIPADRNIEYTNINNINSISEDVDTGAFYVIDLEMLENVTLNYGKDYEKIRNGEATTEEEINKLTDLYIINADSHNIFYVDGIELDGEIFYTDYAEEDKDVVPVGLIDIKKVKDMKFGASSTYFLLDDGSLWVTGLNQYGQLGLGDTENRNTLQKVEGIPKLKKIYVNMYCVFTITENEEVYAWGLNDFGQLGLGEVGNKTLPTKLNITDVRDVYPYWFHNFIIKNDGSVWSCGRNTRGQLGLGDKTSRSTFTKVNINNVKDIKLGNEHSAILKNDGTLWVTGSSFYGQLGFGNNTDLSTFTKTSLTDVKQIVNGREETKVLKNDGTVWGSGSNLRGELGIGSTSGGNTFKKAQIENVKELKCEYGTVIAITNDNKIYGWRNEQ